MWEYISVWTEPHGGFQWRGCRVDCEGWWQWLQWTMPLCPCPTPLFSGRPIARRVPGPSQPSFPHGKYLMLSVAHVCHITHRFRRGKKHCMYDEWWSYGIGSWWKDILFFCGALTVKEHTYICTHHHTSNTCTTPGIDTHHTFPPPLPMPGMCKHGPHLASTTFFCDSPKKGKTKMGVYVYILCS